MGKRSSLNPHLPTRFTFLNMILGWCTERQWLCSPAGIHIRDFTSTAQGSHLDCALQSDYLAASAGVGITGHIIGSTEAAAAFTEAEDSMEEAGATEAGATDSSHGVIQP